MKTIEVSDTMYSQLMGLSLKLTTQDDTSYSNSEMELISKFLRVLPDIMQAVLIAVDYDIEKYKEIQIKTRKPEIAHKRWKVFTILYNQGFSQVSIGKFFKSPSSTVHHGLRGFKKIIEAEERISKIVKF